jgi:hypothetical protein
MSELLAITAVIVTLLLVAVAVVRHYLPSSFTEFLEQLGKRGGSDFFDR